MRISLRKLTLVILVVVVVLPITLYFLADNWLESSGGRALLERNLSDRIGMAVRLDGEFDLMLLPDIGVSGTGLVIEGQDPDSEFARSDEFEISVALRPLLDRKVRVEWIRLTGGHVYPEHYSRSGDDGATMGLQLPEVQELAIRDIQIVLPGAVETRLAVKELALSGFAENRETPFFLEIADLFSINGSLRWNTEQSLLHFATLQIDVGGQALSGEGCFEAQAPRSLHLDLRAAVFDLDSFRDYLPATGGEGGGRALEVRARLTADELISNGAVARGVVFSLGDEPTCKKP